MLVAEGNNSLSDVKEILSIIPDKPELGKKQELFDSKTFSDFTAALENLRQPLSSQSRTAKLWLLYMDYIGILKKFIFAERTCNWNMHLEATTDMLNLFASSGHIN